MRDRLLFVEANTTGTGMLALKRVKDLGYRPLFLTNKPGRYAGLAETGCPVLECDTNSLPALRETLATHVGLDELVGVATTSEFYLPTVAELAGECGVPGNPPAAMHTCRNKALTREALAANGVGQPQFAVIRDLRELAGALTHVGLPCVVKPADDTGSNDVLLCATAAQAEAHANQILAQSVNVRGQQTARTVLIEEYLDAPEFSVEMFTWNGVTTCIGITEKSLTGFPHFVESRHIFQALLPPNDAAELRSTVTAALRAVGFTHGASHTEIKLTPRGGAIVEINARLAGGMIPEIIRLATGVDMVEQQIRSFVGLEPELASQSQRCVGIQFIVARAPGRLVEIRGAEEARAMPGVATVTLTARPGADVALPRSAYDRLGYIIADGNAYDETVFRLQAAADRIEVLTREATKGD